MNLLRWFRRKDGLLDAYHELQVRVERLEKAVRELRPVGYCRMTIDVTKNIWEEVE